MTENITLNVTDFITTIVEENECHPIKSYLEACKGLKKRGYRMISREHKTGRLGEKIGPRTVEVWSK